MHVTPFFSEYIPDNSADTEPDFQYTPDSYSVTSPLPPGGDPLAGSLSLLQEGLDGGATLTQFEVSSDAEHCYVHVHVIYLKPSPTLVVFVAAIVQEETWSDHERVQGGEQRDEEPLQRHLTLYVACLFDVISHK